MSWNLFEKILSVFSPQNDTDQQSEQAQQWPESSNEQPWQEGTESSTVQPEASQEPSPSSPQTSCSIEQPDDSEQPESNKDWQQE
jgi:hypothetical protein